MEIVVIAQIAYLRGPPASLFVILVGKIQMVDLDLVYLESIKILSSARGNLVQILRSTTLHKVEV